MVADRETAVANFKHDFTPEEACAYPDLANLVRCLRGIKNEDYAISFTSDLCDRREDLVQGLLIQGRLYSKENWQYVDMELRACHDNSIQLVKQRPHLRVIRGWAFHGGWQGHSWAWDPGSKIIYETTTAEREIYFGWDITHLCNQKAAK